jgi:GntR family transcriptional regulator
LQTCGVGRPHRWRDHDGECSELDRGPADLQTDDGSGGRILEGAYPEGELLPSVRQLAVDFGVSPLTAAKVFTELQRENLTEKRRGIGFEVRKGVRKVLLHRERKKFLEEEWPEIRARMKRMGIEMRDLPRE